MAAAQFVLCALKGYACAASMLHCARDTPKHSIGPAVRSALEEEAVQDAPGELVVHADAHDVIVERHVLVVK
jgi:hypothetical protein